MVSILGGARGLAQTRTLSGQDQRAMPGPVGWFIEVTRVRQVGEKTQPFTASAPHKRPQWLGSAC